MKPVCPNHDCPNCPICDRVMAALQKYPGERVELDDIEIRAGHSTVLIHLLHLWKAEMAAPSADGCWSTSVWPQHEEECESIWETSA